MMECLTCEDWILLASDWPIGVEPLEPPVLPELLLLLPGMVGSKVMEV